MEFNKQKFNGINERPVEYRFVFKHLTNNWPKSVLDIGTGATALPHLMRTCGFLVTAADNVSDYWPNGMINRHYHVKDDDITNTRLIGPFDLITCVSVLEHIKDHISALQSIFSLLASGGYLILTFPYNENFYCGNVYDHVDSTVTENFPFVTQAYSRSELDQWLSQNKGIIIDQEYWQFFTGDFWTCGQRVQPPVQVNRDDLHQLTCILIKKT
jgi:2-polyprenyl-3-methyl-5-hydroxy-6-metoxy-1,4-benzoquinol methylase